METGGVEGTGLHCAHGCSLVGEELLCLGDFIISHLSERVRGP